LTVNNNTSVFNGSTSNTFIAVRTPGNNQIAGLRLHENNGDVWGGGLIYDGGIDKLQLGMYNGSTTFTPMVNIGYNGHVGIGTTNPQWATHLANTGGNVITNSAQLAIMHPSTTAPFLFEHTQTGIARITNYVANATTALVSLGALDLWSSNANGTIIYNTFANSKALSVSGGVTVGSAYNNTTTPSNGIIVEGFVGIGITNPTSPLHVFGPTVAFGGGGGTATVVQIQHPNTGAPGLHMAAMNTGGSTFTNYNSGRDITFQTTGSGRLQLTGGTTISADVVSLLNVMNPILGNNGKIDVFLGKSATTANGMYMTYNHVGDGLSTNNVGFGFHGSGEQWSFNANGTLNIKGTTGGPPTVGTPGTTRGSITLFGGTASTFPYAIGIESSTMWFNTGTSGTQFKWYTAGVQNAMLQNASLFIGHSLINSHLATALPNIGSLNIVDNAGCFINMYNSVSTRLLQIGCSGNTVEYRVGVDGAGHMFKSPGNTYVQILANNVANAFNLLQDTAGHAVLENTATNCGLFYRVKGTGFHSFCTADTNTERLQVNTSGIKVTGDLSFSSGGRIKMYGDAGYFTVFSQSDIDSYGFGQWGNGTVRAVISGSWSPASFRISKATATAGTFTDMVVVNSSGDVNIGVNSGVVRNITSPGQLRILANTSNTVNNSGLILAAGTSVYSGNGWVGIAANNYDYAYQIVVNKNQQVGIGTSLQHDTPLNAQLTVSGGTTILNGSATVGNQNHVFLQFISPTFPGDNMFFTHDGMNPQLAISGADTAFHIAMAANQNIGVGTLRRVISCQNNGNVGIGIENPSTLLDVNGDTTIRGRLVATSLGPIADWGKFTVVSPSSGELNSHITIINTGTSGSRARISILGQYGVNNSARGSFNIDHAHDGGGLIQNWGGTISIFAGTTESIRCTTTTTTIFNTSDYRLKNNISLIVDALDKVSSINTYSFTYSNDESNTKRWGAIAHELQDVLPELVTGTKDEVDEDGTPKYQSVDYISMIPIMLAAIKDLANQVKELQAKVV
jgi:hypothetical protein